MDLLIEIVIWIIKAILKGREQTAAARQDKRTTLSSTRNTRQPQSSANLVAGGMSARGQRQADMTRNRPEDDSQVRQAGLSAEQKTVEIWEAYRKKQEALEAQFRAKAPK